MTDHDTTSYVPDVSQTAAGQPHEEPAKPTGPSRRSVLAGGAAIAAGFGMASLLPASFQRVLAEPAPPGDPTAIKHLVLYMQENRSFDHYFGTLNGVRGYGDPTVLPRRGGGTLFAQPRGGTTTGGPKDSDIRPFKVHDAVNASRRNAEYIATLPHSFPDGHAAWADGWWDGWIPAKGTATMCGYDRTDLPLHYALADAFTICDQYFASIQAGTSPNRNYWQTGHSGFEPLCAKRAVDNAAYKEFWHLGYDWVTQAELLQDAGVSWKVYMEWDNYGDNNLEYFKTFKRIMRTVLWRVKGLHANCTSFYDHLGRLAKDGKHDEVDDLLAQLDRSVEQLPARERDLFNRGLRRGRPGTLVKQFRADAAAGTLPQVCYIVPSSVDSEHPSGSSPLLSAHITHGLLEVMGDHPSVWRSSAIVYTFDEFDGYFDHVPPPVAPPRHKDEVNEHGKPMGLGARVPTLIMSPWTVGGHVCSEVFDHTSAVKLVERVTGVKTDQISAWRRDAVGDLTSAFDFSGGQALRSIPAPATVPAFSGRWKPQPGDTFTPIPVEQGARPARALPYQTMAELSRATDGTLQVLLTNSGKRPAPMAVYGFGGETKRPVHDVVAGSKTVSLRPVGQTYRLVATGPNGFRCDFDGRADADPIRVAARASAKDGLLLLRLFSLSEKSVTVRVNDEPVELAAGAMATRDLPSSDGWFDVTVTVAGDSTFRQHFRGHIENGAPSVTGPMLDTLNR